MQKITKLVAREGLIGLQKLEAQGIIQGYCKDKFRNFHERREDRSISLAIAKGIGRNSDCEKVKEMIEWLDDAEYLIDYGYIFVTLLQSVTYENPSSFSKSKYMEVVEVLRSEDDRRFNVKFVLDYRKKFCPNVIQWLEEIDKQMIPSHEFLIVKTKFGYSYIDKKDYPYKYKKNTIPYMKFCNGSGLHYSRYWGTFQT